MREFPSKWTPVGLYKERNCNVRIIDYFKIKKKSRQNINTKDISSILTKSQDEELISHKIDSSQTNSIDLESNDCMHGEEVACSNILHKALHSSDSICDYGEDITIERGILNWCDEDEAIQESKPLDRPIIQTKEIFMEYFPTLWKTLPLSSKKCTTIDCEPSLWDSDVGVVLSNEPIELCTLEKDVNINNL